MMAFWGGIIMMVCCANCEREWHIEQTVGRGNCVCVGGGR